MFGTIEKTVGRSVIKFLLKRMWIWLKTKFFYREKYKDNKAKIIIHIMKIVMGQQKHRTTDVDISNATGVDIRFTKKILNDLHNDGGILYSQTLTNGPKQVDGLTGIFLLYNDFNPIDLFDIECARIQIEHYLSFLPGKSDTVSNISSNIGYDLFYVYAALSVLEFLKFGRYIKVMGVNNPNTIFKMV